MKPINMNEEQFQSINAEYLKKVRETGREEGDVCFSKCIPGKRFYEDLTGEFPVFPPVKKVEESTVEEPD